MVLFSFLHILLFHCFTAFPRSLISVASPVLSLTYLIILLVILLVHLSLLLLPLLLSLLLLLLLILLRLLLLTLFLILFLLLLLSQRKYLQTKVTKTEEVLDHESFQKNKVTPNLSKKQKGSKRSFRMCTGISRIAQHKDVPRHGVKDGLQRHSGIRASNDGGVRRLSQIYQVLTHLLTGAGIDLRTFDEALISFLRFGRSPQDELSRRFGRDLMEDFGKPKCKMLVRT